MAATAAADPRCAAAAAAAAASCKDDEEEEEDEEDEDEEEEEEDEEEDEDEDEEEDGDVNPPSPCCAATSIPHLEKTLEKTRLAFYQTARLSFLLAAHSEERRLYALP